jgi:hypothetical protein
VPDAPKPVPDPCSLQQSLSPMSLVSLGTRDGVGSRTCAAHSAMPHGGNPARGVARTGTEASLRLPSAFCTPKTVRTACQHYKGWVRSSLRSLINQRLSGYANAPRRTR